MKVSVVIPTYNSETTIRQTIESVLGQTYRDIEIIIVDDCSKDDTAKIVRTYKRENIVMIDNEKNEGPSTSRNKGIMRATGRFVAFLDSDDLWPEDYIENAVAYLNRHAEYAFCVSQGFVFRGQRTVRPLNNYFPFLDKKQVVYSNSIGSPSGVVFIREILLNYSFPKELRYFEDFSLYFNMCKSLSFGYCESTYYYYRLTEKNATRNIDEKFVMKQMRWFLNSEIEYLNSKEELLSIMSVFDNLLYYKNFIVSLFLRLFLVSASSTLRSKMLFYISRLAWFRLILTLRLKTPSRMFGNVEIRMLNKKLIELLMK